MSNSSLGTREQLRDPNYTPPLAKAIPLGIQHVLAMFASNVTPAIIIAGVAGFGFGKPDAVNLIYMIQMSMLFAGIATLIQTIGLGPIGAKLPIVQGTSFAFLPVMIPAVAGAGVAGMGGLMTGVIIGGIFHFIIGLFIGKIRFALPPLVTGLIVLMIGLALVKVGIQYAAGGAGDFNMSKPEWGGIRNWSLAFIVILVTLGFKFFTRGLTAVAAVLIGILVGYIAAYFMGMVSFAGVGRAASFEIPTPFKWGWEINWAIVIGMCLMAFISAIETVGDVSGITKGGAGREATDKEITGATFADGLGTAIAGVFGGLPNTSFSQNVGLISMTGVMSRHVVTIGAIFLVIAGLIPKIGAAINTIPYPVLGGGVIVMFGMVAAAGVSMLSDVKWNRRNMIIFAVALAFGLGLQLVPDAMKFLSPMMKTLMTSGLLPAAFIAIFLNLVLPEDLDGDDDEEVSGDTALGGLGSLGDRAAGLAGGAAGLAGGVAATGAGLAGGATAAVSGATGAVASGLSSAGSAASGAAAMTGSVAASALSGSTNWVTADRIAGGAGDDVELIDGIGPKIGASLKAQGLVALSQIAAMPEGDLAALAQHIGIPEGQPSRQEWKVQAEEMLGGAAPRAAIDRK